MQEFNSAKFAVEQGAREMGADVHIEKERIDHYPVFVEIVGYMDDGEEKVLWRGRQQALFRKNASMRQRSIQEIAAAVRAALKEPED